MRSLSSFVALALAVVVAAVPSKDCNHKVKESVPPPRGWTKSAPAPKDQIIELRIALPQSNFDELERHLYEVRSVIHTRLLVSC